MYVVYTVNIHTTAVVQSSILLMTIILLKCDVEIAIFC